MSNAPAALIGHIAVLGLGKVGMLAAELLHHAGFSVTAYDQRETSAHPGLEIRSVDVADLDVA